MKLAARRAVHVASKLNVWLYRRTNGRVGGKGMGGLPLLLLTVPGPSTCMEARIASAAERDQL